MIIFPHYCYRDRPRTTYSVNKILNLHETEKGITSLLHLILGLTSHTIMPMIRVW